MKKLLYLITILVLLCTSCKTKQTLQEFSEQTDSAKTEYSSKKEMAKEESSASSNMEVSDTMSSAIIEEEFNVEFDSAGKPKSFHGKKKNQYCLQSLKKTSPWIKILQQKSYLAIAISSWPTSTIQNTIRKYSQKRNHQKTGFLLSSCRF